jgi:hypothetical protein
LSARTSDERRLDEETLDRQSCPAYLCHLAHLGDGSRRPAPTGRTVQGAHDPQAKDSTPDFPSEVQAPKGTPNVLVILTDDVGFGVTTPFGGPVPTPTMERLAQEGLRYTQFHTTALCSPTRAAPCSA